MLSGKEVKSVLSSYFYSASFWPATCWSTWKTLVCIPLRLRNDLAESVRPEEKGEKSGGIALLKSYLFNTGRF